MAITTSKKTKRTTKAKNGESKGEQPQEIQTSPIKPEDRNYCTNAQLLKEMFKWKNSTTQGIPVMKIKRGKSQMVPTEIDYETDAIHEKYKQGTTYVIKYPKTHERYQLLLKQREEEQKHSVKKGAKMAQKSSRKLKMTVRSETDDYVIEDVTEKVKRMGFAFDIDDNEMHRTISNELGEMMMKITRKISNHSFFRNYDEGTKQECQSYAWEKIIRGLPNYNFKYDNVFSYMTQACFNSFKSILSKYYRHINLKRQLTKRLMVDIESAIPNSSINKCLGNQFKGNDYDDFSSF